MALLGVAGEGFLFVSLIEGAFPWTCCSQRCPRALWLSPWHPRKAFNRVWLTTGERGLIGEPVSLPVLGDGVDELERLIGASGGPGRPGSVWAAGPLHRGGATEIERRWPGSLRLFAPSETTAARAQLGSRRVKTDEPGCAALIGRLRRGAGRPAEPEVVAAMLGTVAHRRQLVDARRVLQQRLHDQL